MDVAQNRVPFYQASEEVLGRARRGEFAALLPAHALTTIHYLLGKWGGTPLANQTVDDLLKDFVVPPVDGVLFRCARQLPMPDFEDAVVASVAEASGSDYIVTRNVPDFAGPPVPALTPADFLALLTQKGTPPQKTQ